MKRALFFLPLLMVLVASCEPVFAQDVDTLSRGTFYQDTLATASSVDTIQAGFDVAILRNNVTYIVAYTTTGTDTVKVFSQAANGLTWVRSLLTTSMVTPVEDSIMVVTTTPREWIIFGTLAPKYLLVTSDVSASTVFIIGGKRIYY